MRAAVYHRYGPADVLRVEDVPSPRPGRHEVLVRVARAALNPKDALVRKGKFRILTGRRFPKRCGLDLAGEVVDSRSGRFEPGQRVFGFLDEWTCRRGTLAELVVCQEREIARSPAAVSDEAGAAIALAGLTALQALAGIAKTGAGQRVLVHGAAGGVGTPAIQIARLLGAEVHTVSSATNQALCADLGAHRTWTYPEHAWTRDGAFDVIFDVFGSLRFHEIRPHLERRGVFVSTVPTVRRLVRDGLTRLAPRQERLVVVRPDPDGLTRLAGWMTEGKLRAVIDSRHALADLGAAFARLESKRARGKIVVEIAG